MPVGGGFLVADVGLTAAETGEDAKVKELLHHQAGHGRRVLQVGRCRLWAVHESRSNALVPNCCFLASSSTARSTPRSVLVPSSNAL